MTQLQNNPLLFFIDTPPVVSGNYYEVIFNGGEPMLDIRRGANWYDNPNTGAVNTGIDANAMSGSDKEVVANVGLIYLLLNRGLTNTGQTKLAELRAINPNLQWIGYQWIHHVNPAKSTAPSGLLLQDWEADNIPLAVDINSNPVVNWYTGPTPLLYTTNMIYPQTSGYLFNKELVDSWMDTWLSAIEKAFIPPIGIMLDYFMTYSAGVLPAWPGNPAPDLNENGINILSEPAEKDGVVACNVYVCQKIKERLGNDFIILANGRAPYYASSHTSERQMQAEINGQFCEAFPSTPFNIVSAGVSYSLSSIYDAYNSSGIYRTHKNRNFLWTTAQENTVSIASSGVLSSDAARLACIMFDGIYFYSSNVNNNWSSQELYDNVYHTWKTQLGAPLDAPYRDGAVSGIHHYLRNFENGTIRITVNPNNSTSQYSQLTFAGIE